MNLRILRLVRRTKIGTRVVGYCLADEPTKVWPTQAACLQQTSQPLEYVSETDRAADGWVPLSGNLLELESDPAFS